MKLPPIIQAEFKLSGRLPMISAIGEQNAVTLWEYVIDKRGVYWFWPKVHPEPGHAVHCGDHVKAGKKSEGYGGRVMTFPTKDGDIPIAGPWHSNSDALFAATGVDLRDKHWTFGVIALRQDYEPEGWGSIYKDVIFIDPPEGVIGHFDRVTKMAQELAEKHQRIFYVYSRSSGGSSDGPCYPKAWDNKRVQAEFAKERENNPLSNEPQDDKVSE